MTVTTEGTARDAKAGAVVVTERGAVYVEKLESWPAAVHGKKVRVTGEILTAKILPDPVNAKGEIVQGAWGDQSVIRDAAWEVVA